MCAFSIDALHKRFIAKNLTGKTEGKVRLSNKKLEEEMVESKYLQDKEENENKNTDMEIELLTEKD